MKEQMNIVIIGHVDHGKSTVIGRLLADTDSLPQGKLENVKKYCKKNSRVFEYAFLLDALKEEQAQGITMDSARCFFKTEKRDYIIIDAPGHVEFIKNMITGASRADSALIVIDVKEGIQENSRRHGYLVSMLGIRQISVVVNKMDLVNYDEAVFEKVKNEYTQFLDRLGVIPVSFIPISARNGENMLSLSEKMPWYKGLPLTGQIDAFSAEEGKSEKAFRFPVQDVYKFTDQDDDRRILAGLVTSGSIRKGDQVLFAPSGKKSRIKSIELFPDSSLNSIGSGFSAGFTLEDPLYIKAGEIMYREEESISGNSASPFSSRKIRASFFWMGNAPLLLNRNVKLKIGTASVIARLTGINNVIDASDLSSEEKKEQLDRYDVADCVFETSKPVAFDKASEFETTGRFVLIDNFEISGCGIILDSLAEQDSFTTGSVRNRETQWDKSLIPSAEREQRNKHKAKFILFTGAAGTGKRAFAKELEKYLFENQHQVYYLGISSLAGGLARDLENRLEDHEEEVRRIGELARIMTDAGIIFITILDHADDYDLEKIKLLNAPSEILVIQAGNEDIEKYPVDLKLPTGESVKDALEEISLLLKRKEIIPEYFL